MQHSTGCCCLMEYSIVASSKPGRCQLRVWSPGATATTLLSVIMVLSCVHGELSQCSGWMFM